MMKTAVSLNDTVVGEIIPPPGGEGSSDWCGLEPEGLLHARQKCHHPISFLFSN